VPSRIVCYSVSPPDEAARRQQMESQLVRSVTSLRAHNQTIPVAVYWLGPLAQSLQQQLARLDIEVRRRESYGKLMNDFPHGDLLAQYPFFHKYLVLEDEASCSQLLLIDCDTFFLGDVQLLFERYCEADIYGCPEAGSKRGNILYDSEYLDEEALWETASKLGARGIAPFNCGALMFSRATLVQMPNLARLTVELSLRLMAWIAMNATPELNRPELTELRSRLHLKDGKTAEIESIPYPSSNHWIVEEVAFWLAVGMLPDLTTADFDSRDVALGGDVILKSRAQSKWILGHYFSSNHGSAVTWWQTWGMVRQKTPDSAMKITRLPMDETVLRSRLVVDHSGFAAYEDLIPTAAVQALKEEAFDQYWAGQEQHLALNSGGQGRDGHPARKLVTSDGGEVQNEIYHSGDLRQFLMKVCGVPVRPSGPLGSYLYYTRQGDFIDLHLDVVECELVALTILNDSSDMMDMGGAYRIFPTGIGKPLSSVRMIAARGGGIIAKLKPGQTLIMFGGVVPHLVVPVHSHQSRVVSALCFHAGESA
jgi:hypothetical protein